MRACPSFSSLSLSLSLSLSRARSLSLSIVYISVCTWCTGTHRSCPFWRLKFCLYKIVCLYKILSVLKTNRYEDPQELSFLEAVFSVVFGDGDPNSRLEVELNPQAKP